MIFWRRYEDGREALAGSDALCFGSIGIWCLDDTGGAFEAPDPG